MNTLVYDRVDRCVVFLCGGQALDQREWNDYVAFLRTHFKPGLQNRSLVMAPGGTLSSVQRKDLAQVLKPIVRTTKSAVLTDSAVVRGIVTALQWFNRDVFRMFAPSELDRALGFLDIHGMEAQAVKHAVAVLQKKLAARAPSAA